MMFWRVLRARLARCSCLRPVPVQACMIWTSHRISTHIGRLFMRWFINPFGSQGSGAFENLLFSHDPMPTQVHRGGLQSSCAVFLHKHAPTMSIDEEKYDALELSHHGNNSILLGDVTPPQRHAISSTPTSRSRLSEPPFVRPQTDLQHAWTCHLDKYDQVC